MGNPNLIFQNMKISKFFASILVVTICLNICLASKIKYDRRRSQHREGVEKLRQVGYSQNPGFSQVKSSQNPGFSQVGYSQHSEGVEKLSQKQLYDLSQHREGVEKLSQVKHSQNPGFSQVKSSQNPGFSQVGYSQHREGVEKL